MANLVSVTPVAAVTIQSLDVTHNQGRYHITFNVLLAADLAKTYELVSDHRKWPQLFRTLKKTRLVTTFPDGRQRIRLTFRSCVLFICRRIRQLKDVSRQQTGDIFTRIVPDGKYFESGWEHWHLIGEEHDTRVQYRAELVPGFRSVPLIGPWILKNKLRRSLLWAAKKAEALAAP
ncbi:MAG: SRPBCC family protein, partial [Acidiferrobacterales bacterium]